MTMENQGSISFTRFPQTKAFIILLMVLMLAGVFVGALSYRQLAGTELAGLHFAAQNFISARTEQGFFQICWDSLRSSGGLLLACFLFGFCAIAQPAELLVPFFRGLGLGASIACIYAEYSVKGFFIAFILIVPNAVISSFAIVIAARESVRLSNIFSSFAFADRCDRKMPKGIQLYLLKFVVLFVIIVISSLIDSVLTVLFAKMLL